MNYSIRNMAFLFSSIAVITMVFVHFFLEYVRNIHEDAIPKGLLNATGMLIALIPMKSLLQIVKHVK